MARYSHAGSEQYAPAASCQDILDNGHSAGSGRYWLKEDTWTSAVQHYCIMPTKEGDSAVDVGGDGATVNGAGGFFLKNW